MRKGLPESLLSGSPLSLSLLLGSLILLLPAVFVAGVSTPRAMAATVMEKTNVSACQDLPHSDHPNLRLSNGVLDTRVFLPDATRGFYRASRFDWSGMIGCVAYKGHRYFGEWLATYDPMVNDSVTGPVEEFQMEDALSGYADGKPDALFVKIGVGVLRKSGNSPYRFNVTYPLVDGGTWTTRSHGRSVSFKQHLQSPIGIAYTYEKRLTLEKNQPVMTLEHRLKNEGTKPIVTNVYDHDFYMLDGRSTGPGITVTFPFDLKPEGISGDEATVEGRQVIYRREVAKNFAVLLKGYSESPASYDFTAEDQKTGVGVEQSSDHPISRLFLWSAHDTVCPEAFIHLEIPPGRTAQWKIHYRFFANSQ